MQNKSIYDKATQSWFSLHPCSETTVMKCDKCGLLYKPSLGHKCGVTDIDVGSKKEGKDNNVTTKMVNENVFPDTHLTLACLYTMATKGNFQNHKHEVADIMQKVLDLDRAVRKEGAENDNK